MLTIVCEMDIDIKKWGIREYNGIKRWKKPLRFFKQIKIELV